MPVIWQSSQRPMYVRTVWVDGFRHAILNTDDPHFLKLKAKRRPHSSISYQQKDTIKRESRLSHRGENLEGCLRNQNLVITSESLFLSEPKISASETEIELLNLQDLEQETDEDFVLKSKSQRLNVFESFRTKFSNFVDMKTLKSNRTCRTEMKEDTELSDRVLQWLDLAGKIDLLAPESENTRMAQPRHSWPDVKRNNLAKSNTTVDFKKSEKETPKDSLNEKVERADIDRQEFYVPVPTNTIETYARQSRNKNVSRNEPTKPTIKARSKELRRNVQETRQKIETEKNEVEKQYAELVSRKILPNYTKSKKQVHIFIPVNRADKNSSLISGASKN